MRAYCLIRPQPWYRSEAFAAGLRAAGHQVLMRAPDRYDRDTLLLIWNRYGEWHELANRAEQAGGRVLVAENGYMGVGGVAPKFAVHPAGPKPGDHYALAENWHNGGGRWPAGDGTRWAALGVEIRPWRTSGEHILICPNRSFGPPSRAMHVDWAERCAARLAKQTKRPVRIRAHPGNDKPKRDLSADLANAWAVVIWSSGAGVHALAAGIPVFCEAPFWVMKGAAAGGTVDEPTLPERLPHLERMAWAQWTCEEIASGEPFRRLLA